MGAFDPGPPDTFATIFDGMPDHSGVREHFWFDWGPVFYRGRLDGSARLLGIASDPGEVERVAGRTLVGDAGQRVQGFLAKLGLTRSYLLLNAFPLAFHPSHWRDADDILEIQAIRDWRNSLYDAARSPNLQAVVAFGRNAQRAVDLWPGAAGLPVIRVPHPSSHDAAALLTAYRAAVTQLRAIVTPDADGIPRAPNYGSTFREQDYRRIPTGDLPFGVPPWLGDSAAGRAMTPRRNNWVDRADPDDEHTLIWTAPRT
jgi:hypothetical protein